MGRGPDAVTYHVEIPNVATLESNSPVMINDVVVGSVGKMTVDNWHANVEVSVKPDVVVPANAVATVGQTSLLGSMHLALNPPLGEKPSGRLQPGATIPLNQSSTYPSTEQTLSSLSAVVNGGGLGQIGDIIHNFSAACRGREPRDPGTAHPARQFRRRAGRPARQHRRVDQATEPGGRNVRRATRRDRSRAQGGSARLGCADQGAADADHRAGRSSGQFSDTATELVNDAGDDLVTDLKNLEPAIKALADIGPDLSSALICATAFPYGPGFADTITRGDYINLIAIFDLTYPRLKRTLFLGTRWGDENAKLIPAPGDPYYLNYSYNPMSVGVAPPPAEAQPTAPNGRAARRFPGRCCRWLRRRRHRR